MKISDYRIGFVGFGHLAQVICRAIERAKLIPRSRISFVRRDPAKIKKCEQEFGITATSLEHLVDSSDLLLLCVRPHQAKQILPDLARLGAGSKKIVTLLAGVRLALYQKHLGSPLEIARAMPNIASAAGEGVTAFCFGPDASSEFRSAAQMLFSSLGKEIEVDESQMDIACGIAGSGPGFVFRLIEAMARAGEKNGLPYEKALKMAAQAFAGAARLIANGAPPEALIEQIATPNGTTEAGFKAMTQSRLDAHFQQAIEASARRSRELSEEIR